jgi:hypothetical protein
MRLSGDSFVRLNFEFSSPMQLAKHQSELMRQQRARGLRMRDILRWRIAPMDLWLWLPGTFLLGLAGLGLCYVFLIGCEGI